jgi:ATP-dependent DNA ligase
VSLPLQPILKPQLALSRKELPTGEEYVYEVKLDGFRCLAFVDGDDVFLQSRNGKPLGRYFPELVFPSGRYVLDGEIVVRDADGREDFDALGQRIHPAVSRIERLSGETPAVYVAFDLLAHEQESLLELAFAERREALERLIDGEAFARVPVELMPIVASAQEAQRWLEHAEGAIAKEPDTVGALILGLYDGEQLRVVGHCSGLSVTEKKRLVGFLGPYESGERGSADASRWSAGKELEWVALRPELVVEIDFDHVSAGRIRHGAKLRRWREDKPPRECTYDQLR